MIARRFRHAGASDSGFTLIELLVVMLIIGVLAAIAIPVFLNQQKTARDNSVTSDVKNAAGQVQALLVTHPDASSFGISTRGESGLTSAQAFVTVDGTSAKTSLSDGVIIALQAGDSPGEFKVYGWHLKGKSYATQALVYDSGKGGLQKAAAPLPAGVPSTINGGTSGTPVVDARWTHSGEVDVAGTANLTYTIKWTPSPTAGSYSVKFTEYKADGSTIYNQVGVVPSGDCAPSSCSYTFPYGNGTATAHQVVFTVTPVVGGVQQTPISGTITMK